MAFVKKTWVDRDAENLGGRKLTDNTSGVVSHVTVELEEGTVYEQGDSLNAETFNDLEDRIETGFNTIPSGGSDVEVTPIVTSGVDIATITVDEVATTIKAPSQVSEIDDTSTASNKTWSANKLNGLLILDVTNVGV